MAWSKEINPKAVEKALVELFRKYPALSVVGLPKSKSAVEGIAKDFIKLYEEADKVKNREVPI